MFIDTSVQVKCAYLSDESGKRTSALQKVKMFMRNQPTGDQGRWVLIGYLKRENANAWKFRRSREADWSASTHTKNEAIGHLLDNMLMV